MLSRSAPRRLLAGLRAAAVDEEAVVAMASPLGRPGTAAAAAADVLAPLVGRNPEQADDHADRALAALALVAPTQASPLLAGGLGRRPRALDAAAGFLRPADGSWSPTRSYKAFAAGSEPSPAAARNTVTAPARSPGALSRTMAAMARSSPGPNRTPGPSGRRCGPLVRRQSSARRGVRSPPV
ncbi:hypothetical protein [Streptomyces sp. NPDC097610]|uniref:hypothetical protein n=1 Tax=Streptomyces sp. NPDC097610 TaxID=3157227 RepID=UPI0033205EDA